MIEKLRILFIVNPLAHAMRGQNVSSAIREEIDASRFAYDIVFTNASGHATKLAQDALASYDIIAAVGGDGTLNEVAAALIHSKGALAVIPVGSGNGLARHLKIPLGLRPALQALNRSEALLIDTGEMNGKPFVVTAGIGFDALVAHRFSSFGKRGLFSYIQIILREYFFYEPQSYRLQIDGKEIDRKAFLIAFANASQYGNDFQVAPEADLEDGYLDLVIAQKPFLNFWRLTGERHRCREVKVFTECTMAHVDGEPVSFTGELLVRIVPKSLRIMVP